MLTMLTMLYSKIISLCLLPLSLSLAAARGLFSSYASILAETIKTRASINDVSDEILLKICAVVKRLPNPSEDEDRLPANRLAPLVWEWRELVNSVKSLLYVAPERLQSPLSALSTTNRRFRNLSAPEIFRNINIGNDWDWRKALRALDSMILCEAVGTYAESFHIDLYIGPTWIERFQDGYDHKGPKPPLRFPLRLLDVLKSLKNVERLTLILPEYHTETFRTTFEAANATFPSVRTLALGPHMDWIIAMCPNVTAVSSHDSRWLHSNVDGNYKHRHSTNLITSAGRASHLQHFEMHEWWTLTQLETVYHSIPSISSLAMPGGEYEDGIESMLPPLSRFKSLRSLKLADAISLGVGFDPPWCGNAYDGPGGQALARQVAEDRRRATQKVVRMVFGRMPWLEQLWIGNHLITSSTREESG